MVSWHSLVLKKLHVHWKEVENIPYFTSPNHTDRVKYNNTSNIKGSRKKLQITPITLKPAKWHCAVSDPSIILQYGSIISEYACDLTEFNVPVLDIKYAIAWASALVRWDILHSVQDADERIQSWLYNKNILWDYRRNIMTRILEFNCKLYTYDWIIFGLLTTQITWIYTGYFSNTISITYAHRIHSSARFLSLLSCELHNYTLNSITIVNHLPHLRQCPETRIWTWKERCGDYTCKMWYAEPTPGSKGTQSNGTFSNSYLQGLCLQIINFKWPRISCLACHSQVIHDLGSVAHASIVFIYLLWFIC